MIGGAWSLGPGAFESDISVAMNAETDMRRGAYVGEGESAGTKTEEDTEEDDSAWKGIIVSRCQMTVVGPVFFLAWMQALLQAGWNQQGQGPEPLPFQVRQRGNPEGFVSVQDSRGSVRPRS